MKLLPETGWFTALRAWREQRRTGQDPGDMGTAFGLDSITVVDFDSTQAPVEGGSRRAGDWQRRLTRRSRL
ncbi:MAG: hypothetical protein ACREXI_05315 [Caldimonas sp.]